MQIIIFARGSHGNAQKIDRRVTPGQRNALFSARQFIPERFFCTDWNAEKGQVPNELRDEEGGGGGEPGGKGDESCGGNRI